MIYFGIWLGCFYMIYTKTERKLGWSPGSNDYTLHSVTENRKTLLYIEYLIQIILNHLRKLI